MTATTIRCIVSGAGPVGTLAALYAARRGWQVELFEIREGSTDSMDLIACPHQHII